MAFDTFDTDSVATAGVVFTNSNLTAQGGSGATLSHSMIAQALEGKKSGKWYVEFTCIAVSGNIDGVGIVNGAGLGLGFIGSGIGVSLTNGWAFYTNGHVVNNGTNITAVNTATFTTSDVIGVAIDLDNQKIWFRKNTGSWIGTSGTPDPATNTSGFALTNSLSNNNRVYPAANLSGSAAKFTANFGATSFTGSVPSGFNSGWTNTTSGTYFGTFATTGNVGTEVPAPTSNNDKAVSKYTATLSGSVTSIIFAYGIGASDLKGVIYDATGTGGLPGALLGVSSNTISSPSPGENILNFSGVSVTSGTAYWFGMTSDNVGSNYILCPPQSSGKVFNAANTYASPSNPFGSSPSTANFRYPIIINVSSSASVNLVGIDGTASAGTLGVTADATITLSGVAATVGIGSFSTVNSPTVALSGISATAATGSLSPSVDSAFTLAGISGSALAGLFIPEANATISLQSVLAVGLANDFGSIIVNPTLTVPIITIMNDNPIPTIGAMNDNPIPMEENMPTQIGLEGVMKKLPIPMMGQMFNNPIAGESTVP